MRIEVPKKAEKIIDALQEHGYDAYVVGGCVRDSLLHRSPADWDITTSATPEEVKKIAAAGHDLGNHGRNHVDMSVLDRSQIQQEIQQVHMAVQELTGLEMNLFRAPYGAYGEELLKTVELSGYLPVQWEIDTEDWKNYGIDSILRKVSQPDGKKNGSIIRMHNGADYITQALEPVIISLQEQGYELVPVSRMVYWSDYRIDGNGRQCRSY